MKLSSMNIDNRLEGNRMPSPAVVEDRVAEREQSLEPVNSHRNLTRCFWTIFLFHAVPILCLFDVLKETVEDVQHVGGALAIPISGLGVMAIWSACAKRSFAEKVGRISLATGAMLLLLVVCYGVSLRNAGFLLAPYVFVGALSTAVAIHFATGLVMQPPGDESQADRSTLGTRHLLAIMAAFASAFAILSAFGAPSLKSDFALHWWAVAVGGIATLSALCATIVVLRAVAFQSLVAITVAMAIIIVAQQNATLSAKSADALLGVCVVLLGPAISMNILFRSGYTIRFHAHRRRVFSS